MMKLQLILLFPHHLTHGGSASLFYSWALLMKVAGERRRLAGVTRHIFVGLWGKNPANDCVLLHARPSINNHHVSSHFYYNRV